MEGEAPGTSIASEPIGDYRDGDGGGREGNSSHPTEDPVSEDLIESQKEKYFVVEFSGLIDRLAIRDKLASAKFLGVETNEPILQIDNCFFRGEYQPTLGTNVVFDQKDMSFVAKTDKKLLMKRVFLS